MSKYVYFIRPIGEEGPVKIGCSAMPTSRLATLMVWSPLALELAAQAPGGLDLERNIHECFAHLHLHHEWFRASSELTDVINALRAGAAIEDAIDLSARRGSIRRRERPLWSAELRQYMSYLHRRIHMLKALRKEGLDRWAPNKFDMIMEKWRGRERITPSAEDFAYLEEVLADPRAHCLTREQRWGAPERIKERAA